MAGAAYQGEGIARRSAWVKIDSMALLLLVFSLVVAVLDVSRVRRARS